MCFRAWVAAELGMDDVCRDSAAELLDVAGRTDRDLFYAHAHWKLAILSSYRGDADAALEHVRPSSSTAAAGGPGSGDFLAEAADLLDRVGHLALAREYLDRVAAEPKDAAHLVAMSAAAIESRHGDPVRAPTAPRRGRLDARWTPASTGASRCSAPTRRCAPVTSHGRGRSRRAPSSRRRASASRPCRSSRRPPSPSSWPDSRSRPGTLRRLRSRRRRGPRGCVLGRFELSGEAGQCRWGRPGGAAAQAARVAAPSARGGGITRIWPDSDVASGRNRLRTVLGRLRSAAGDVVERKGDTLALAADVTVDVDRCSRGRRRARRSRAATCGSRQPSRAARWRGIDGELLADDPYEEWVVGHARRARRDAGRALAVCRTRRRTGRPGRGASASHRAIEIDPYGDSSASTPQRCCSNGRVDTGRRSRSCVVRRCRSESCVSRPPGPSRSSSDGCAPDGMTVGPAARAAVPGRGATGVRLSSLQQHRPQVLRQGGADVPHPLAAHGRCPCTGGTP